MTTYFFPEETYTTAHSTRSNVDDHRADEIINALILQTGQQDYDEETVNQLINEYESLMG